MKRIHIVGKDLERVAKMKKDVEGDSFVFVEESPDLVISYGGDGMFLIAERLFPGVPKIPLRDSEVGNMTHDLNLSEVLEKYSLDDYEVQEIQKLKAVRKGIFEIRELVGVNDIVIRNSLPTEAIRFRYRVDGGEWSGVLIGDGVIVSTSYGSNKGAYFHSIVREKFGEGIGVAFNNVVEEVRPIYLASEGNFEVEIVRGIGVMVADNNRDYVNLEKGDKIKIGLIADVARRIILNG